MKQYQFVFTFEKLQFYSVCYIIIQLLIMKKKEVPQKQEIQTPKNLHSPYNLRIPKKLQTNFESKRVKSALKKNLQGSEQQDIGSADRQQLLMLQIKQLRRENGFLKKKLAEFTNYLDLQKGRAKTNKQKQQELNSANLQIMPLSINIFFEEIQSLLSTIVSLFRIQFTEEELKMHLQKNSQQINQTCPIRKHNLLKKYYLKRKLQRIMLENQDQRYPMFIDLFTEYYTYKEQSEEKMLKTVDLMITRAQELNQLIIKKAQERKKTRGTLSTIKKEDDLPFENMNVKITSPKNFVQYNKALANSPNSRKPKKMSKFGLSPPQKGVKIQ